MPFDSESLSCSYYCQGVPPLLALSQVAGRGKMDRKLAMERTARDTDFSSSGQEKV